MDERGRGKDEKAQEEDRWRGLVAEKERCGGGMEKEWKRGWGEGMKLGFKRSKRGWRRGGGLEEDKEEERRGGDGGYCKWTLNVLLATQGYVGTTGWWKGER